MPLIERYRNLYEHEKDCNEKMLGMIESVPEASRDDPRFARALTLAGHLAACRENWLDRMARSGEVQVDWWPADVEPGSLRPRYAELERAWSEYLGGLTDADLDDDFGFHLKDGKTLRFRKAVQVEQLVGHSAYHRGQIALLVEQLGGKPVDTDYLYWAVRR